MSDKTNKNPSANWLNLFLLAAVVGNLLWFQSPLKSSRPSEKESFESISFGDQDAEARLWQDPFEAVLAYENYPKRYSGGRGNTHLVPHDLCRLRQQIEARLAGSGNSLEVLPIMVTGSPYQEGNEWRLRSRYAALAALQVAGYVPEDREHVGFANLWWRQEGSKEKIVDTSKDQTGFELRLMSVKDQAGIPQAGTNLVVIATIRPGKSLFFRVFDGLGSKALDQDENKFPEKSGEIAILKALLAHLPKPQDLTAEQEAAILGLVTSISGLTLRKNATFTPLLVPFEWFKLNPLRAVRTGSSHHILLLWLKDEFFEDHPLERLDQLFTAIQTPCRSESNHVASGKISVKVIGPWSSGTLEAMVKENEGGEGKSNGVPAKFEMFSASATAADALLLGGNASDSGGHPNREPARRERIAKNLKEKGVGFYNAICTDDQLCGALVRELARRGVNFRGDADRVILLSEWDTTYGRSLPEVFYRAATNYAWTILEHANTNLDKTISRFSYLRGVDGKLPKGEFSTSTPSGNTTAGTGQPGPGQSATFQPPEGRSQLDYIPRLVAKLKRENRRQDLRNSKNYEGKIKAIGILGSDVYDKLLLLQSLHNNFPQAIFFTTDLDARLFERSQLKWSRNLVVASSFGLELSDALQKGIPPFRDSYQTAEFLASLVALRCYGTNILTNLVPRLFEIGQGGAYDLSTTNPTVEVSESTNIFLYPSRPDTHTAFFSAALLEALAALFFALLLLYKISPPSRVFFRLPGAGLWGRSGASNESARSSGGENPAQRWCEILALAVLIIVLGYIVAVWFVQRSAVEEPFSLFDGISIWPTEFARLFTFSLCMGFLIKAWLDLTSNNNELADELGQVPANRSARKHPDDADGTSITQWKKVKNVVTEDAPTSAPELWKQYQRKGTIGKRCWRIVPQAVCYLLLGVALTAWLGSPHVPYRGTWSFSLDLMALVLSVGGLIFLIFFVVDATRLCSRFIELTQGKTDWGKAALAYSERMGIPIEYLDDWLDIHFIAKRTSVVCRLIYYPFIVLFLMIVSRTHYFDAWDWPISLVLVLGMNSALAIYCAIRLRRDAEKARRTAVASLNEKLCAVLGGKREVTSQIRAGGEAQQQEDTDFPEPGKPRRAQQIRLLIGEIKSNSDGAFAPFTRNPVVGALLMPFSGAGMLALVSFFTGS